MNNILIKKLIRHHRASSRLFPNYNVKYKHEEVDKLSILCKTN